MTTSTRTTSADTNFRSRKIDTLVEEIDSTQTERARVEKTDDLT